MKRLSDILSALAVIIAVGFIFSGASIIFSESIRADKTSLAYVLISMGCFLYKYALPILISLFFLLILEIVLKARAVPNKNNRGIKTSRWKIILFSDAISTPLIYFVSTLSRVGLILFFISQLSFLFNLCN